MTGRARAALGGLGDVVRDLGASAARPWLWGPLGWNDLRQRHAGSWLGSVWIVLSLALIVASLTLIFARPLGADMRSYPLYVLLGMLLWQWIQGMVTEAAVLFAGLGDTIRNSAMSLNIHLLRLLWKNMIVMAHGLVLVPVLMLATGAPLTTGAAASAAGLLVMLVALFFGSAFLGVLGARFRDVPPLVTNIAQLLFFVSPIFWRPVVLSAEHAWLFELNPVFAFIDIVRAPLLGEAAAPHSWLVALLTTAVVIPLGLAAIGIGRRHLPYWV